MLECLGRFLYTPALEFLKQWLRDWGTILLTTVIAAATVMQGIFAMRLYRLEQAIERGRHEPLLFCRVKGYGLAGKFTNLFAQLSNLSRYGVWIERMSIVLSGPVSCDPEQVREVAMVLAASQTENWQLFSMPFAEIVPLGTGASTAPVLFKLQVKFYYSAQTFVGVQTSPVYDVTVHGTLVTSFNPESKTES